MSVSGVFTSTPTDSGSALDVFPFATIVLAIIFGWILVSSLQRVIEGLFFNTLGLNSRSTVHALIIFIVLFVFFLAFVWMIDEFQVVPAAAAAEAVEGATEGLISGTQNPNTSNVVTSQISAGFKRGQPTLVQPLNFFN